MGKSSMQMHIIFFLLDCMMVSSLIACSGRDACHNITLDTIQKHSSMPGHVEIVSKRDLMGICEVIMKSGSQTVTIYATNDYVIKGSMYSLHKQPTRDHLNELQSQEFMKMKASADNAVCIAYKPSGTIRHTVYMFASPHCPYCARMLAEIKPVLDANNSELKVLFSVAGPDRDAAIEATCKKLNLDTYNTRTWESKDVKDRMSCTDGIKVVDEATALSYKLGIASLPTFFLETGQCISGAKMSVLEKALKH